MRNHLYYCLRCKEISRLHDWDYVECCHCEQTDCVRLEWKGPIPETGHKVLVAGDVWVQVLDADETGFDAWVHTRGEASRYRYSDIVAPMRGV